MKISTWIIIIQMTIALTACIESNNKFTNTKSKKYRDYSIMFMNEVMDDNSPNLDEKPNSKSTFTISPEVSYNNCGSYITSDEFSKRFEDTISNNDIEFMRLQQSTEIESWRNIIDRYFIPSDSIKEYEKYDDEISTLEGKAEDIIENIADNMEIIAFAHREYHIRDSVYKAYKLDTLLFIKYRAHEKRLDLIYGNVHIFYSNPIFTLDGNHAVVTITYNAAPTLGNQTVYVYRKTNNKWKVIESHMNWIS
jgi:hypothetical protein